MYVVRGNLYAQTFNELQEKKFTVGHVGRSGVYVFWLETENFQGGTMGVSLFFFYLCLYTVRLRGKVIPWDVAQVSMSEGKQPHSSNYIIYITFFLYA